MICARPHFAYIGTFFLKTINNFSKYHTIEMSQSSRTWVEQDFCELYEEEPKIRNSSTYVTVHLNIQQDTIPVKIPSKASEDVSKFLLYKAAYFYYLNQKNPNPLHKTAEISCFQSINSYASWYDMWAGRTSIQKGLALHCVSYMKDASLTKYLPLAMIEQRPQFCKYLARSRRNGKYVNICAYSHELINQDFLLFLQSNYKLFQHPFLSRIVQIFRTRSHTYFVFEHNPFSFTEILASSQKLSKEQLYSSFVELLLGLAFLEQQQQLLWELDLEMIEISNEGHFVINEKVILNHKKTHTERNRSNILFLSELYNTLLCTSEIIEDQLSERNKLQVSFSKFLIDLCEISEERKITIKQILTHEWVNQANHHKILAKSNKSFTTESIEKEQSFRELTRGQIESFYKQYLKNTERAVRHDNFQIANQSSNQAILRKYGPLLEATGRMDSFRKRGFKIASCSSLTANLKSSEDLCPVAKPRLTHAFDKSDTNKSPYLSVLKKQGYQRRKKPLPMA